MTACVDISILGDATDSVSILLATDTKRMTVEFVEPPENDWPNDDEANDVMLSYAADDDSHASGGGCTGVVLILILTVIGLSKVL